MDLLLSVTLSAGSGATCRQVRRLLFPEGIFRCVPRLFARSRFEAAVDVDAGQFGVMELPDCFDAVRVDAAAEQKGCHSGVSKQQVPVELIAGTAILWRFGVKQVIVA